MPSSPQVLEGFSESKFEYRALIPECRSATPGPGGPGSPGKLVENADSQAPPQDSDSMDGMGGPPGAHARSDWGASVRTHCPPPQGDTSPFTCGEPLSAGQGGSSDLSGPPDLSPAFWFPLTLRMRLRPLRPRSLHQPVISVSLPSRTRSRLS